MLFEIYKGKRVLVTGHTGFKGSWLVSWLLRLGANVCGYANGIPTDPSLFEELSLGGAIRHELGDIADLLRLDEVVQDFRPDFVFHLAAQPIVSKSYHDPLETVRVNVMGTAALLDTLRRVTWHCTAVIITSDKAYSNVEWVWGYRETDNLGGKDVYSGSKGGAEMVFRSFYWSFFSKSSSVRLASARAGNVIGGGDWAQDRIVADCMRAWISNSRVEIRSPNATRPWLHVLEPLSGYLCLGACLASNAALSGESYNFGPKAEQNARVFELLTALAETWGFTDPKQSFKVIDNVPFNEASLLKLSIDKALCDLRWQPTLSYAECVQMTGTWYRQVVLRHGSAWDVTNEQLSIYEEAAKLRAVDWALAS